MTSSSRLLCGNTMLSTRSPAGLRALPKTGIRRAWHGHRIWDGLLTLQPRPCRSLGGGRSPLGFHYPSAEPRRFPPWVGSGPQHLQRAPAIPTETGLVLSVPARQAAWNTAGAHRKLGATGRPCRRGPLSHTVTEKAARHPTATFFLTSARLVSNPIFPTENRAFREAARRLPLMSL